MIVSSSPCDLPFFELEIGKRKESRLYTRDNVTQNSITAYLIDLIVTKDRKGLDSRVTYSSYKHTIFLAKSILVRRNLWFNGWVGRKLFPSGALGRSLSPCMIFLNEYIWKVQIERCQKIDNRGLEQLEQYNFTSCREMRSGLLMTIHVAVSKHPGIVIDPS